MRVVAWLTVAAVLVAHPAAATGWATIDPGRSTGEEVRARFGAPTRTETQKLEGQDAAQWIYEGAQAPVGIRRMTVELGLVVDGVYRKDVVRALRLEPKPGIFTRRVVVTGWGDPFRTAREGESDVFVYLEGLLVYFDKDGFDSRLMLFTPPQPVPGTTESPRR